MAQVAGKPFLEWVVRYLARQGIRRVVLSTGFLAEVIERHFAAQPVPEVVVTCAPEPQPLGTAGGFLNATKAEGRCPATWLVLNGDSLAFADLPKLAEILTDPNQQGILVGRFVPDASRYGTLVTGPAGQLLGFREKHPGEGIISAGIYCLRNSLLAEFPVKSPLSFEAEVFPTLIQRGIRLKTSLVDTPFLDIGTPDSLSKAEAFVEANRYQFA